MRNYRKHMQFGMFAGSFFHVNFFHSFLAHWVCFLFCCDNIYELPSHDTAQQIYQKCICTESIQRRDDKLDAKMEKKKEKGRDVAHIFV